MSHNDSSSSSPVVNAQPPSRILGLLLLLAASTTGILAALLVFVLFSGPASYEQASAGRGASAASSSSKSVDVTATSLKDSAARDVAQKETNIAKPTAAVIAESVPLDLQVGMRALAADALTMPAKTSKPLTAEAILPGEALERDPLEDLGIKSLRAEVRAALAEAGAFEEVARPELRAEEELARDLESATPELELDRRTLESLVKTSSHDGRLQAVVARLDEIQGMPFRWGDECHSSQEQARALVSVASTVRQMQNMVRGLGNGKNAQVLKQALNRSVAHLLEGDVWQEPHAIPALEQVFQIEGPETRLALVKKLGSIDCRQSTAALVRRALYDFNADVRQAAVEQLDRRPRDEYLETLLEGFRYPWEPVAWHAADAVVQLEAREAAVDLMEMLDAPPTDKPFINERGNWAVKEVVAISHLKNCQLCHTQSVATSDTVRGVVPIPGQAMPQVYYASRNPNMQFVRADVTYLKQDFSLVLDVDDHGPWPERQRFDYVVREVELRGEKTPILSGDPDGELAAAAKEDYGQRQAVIFALQQLVAEDPPSVLSTVKMVGRPLPPSL